MTKDEATIWAIVCSDPEIPKERREAIFHASLDRWNAEKKDEAAPPGVIVSRIKAICLKLWGIPSVPQRRALPAAPDGTEAQRMTNTICSQCGCPIFVSTFVAEAAAPGTVVRHFCNVCAVMLSIVGSRNFFKEAQKQDDDKRRRMGMD